MDLFYGPPFRSFGYRVDVYDIGIRIPEAVWTRVHLREGPVAFFASSHDFIGPLQGELVNEKRVGNKQGISIQKEGKREGKGRGFLGCTKIRV